MSWWEDRRSVAGQPIRWCSGRFDASLPELTGSLCSLAHSLVRCVRSLDSPFSLLSLTQSMSNAPFYLMDTRNGRGLKVGDSVAKDGMILDGLTDAYHSGVHMVSPQPFPPDSGPEGRVSARTSTPA